MAAAQDGNTVYSLNSTEWLKGNSATTKHLWGVAATADHFVAVGTNGTVMSSIDGSIWKTENSRFSGTLLSVAQDGASFVAVGEAGAILHSSTRTSPFFESLFLTDGFQLRLRPKGWSKVQIETSGDLAHWVPVQTFTDQGDGSWIENDLSYAKTNQFYRAICLP